MIRSREEHRIRREKRWRREARQGGRRLGKAAALRVVAEEFRALIPEDRTPASPTRMVTALRSLAVLR